MPDGHDEWEWENKSETYNRIMESYLNENTRHIGDINSFERKVHDAIYGKDEYRFNGGC